MAEKEIIFYLKTISEKTDDIRQEVINLSRRVEALEEKVDALDAKIDKVEERLNARIDELEIRINEVEERLNARIEEVEERLNAKIDMVEVALDTEINSVYQIALQNKNHIETLLIPFNDRNQHANAEIAKISLLEERMGNIEVVVGEHSKLIRRLETA